MNNQEFQSTQILPTTIATKDSSTFCVGDSLARVQVTQEIDLDLPTSDPHSGENSLGSSTSVDQQSLSSKTQQGYSLEEWQQSSKTFTQVRFSHEDRSFEPGLRKVASGIPVGVAKAIKGNYDARRAYGLSCSPRQAAIAWKRIDYLCSLKSCQEA